MRYLILFLLTGFLTINETKSSEKQVWTLVIHYMDGTTHTSVLRYCDNYYFSQTASDTIIYDREILDRVEKYMTEIGPYEPNPYEYKYCDTRLTAVVLYRDMTFDVVCVAGEFYEKACMIVNDERVATHSELVRLLFEIIYDIEEPLTRRLLFGIKD